MTGGAEEAARSVAGWLAEQHGPVAIAEPLTSRGEGFDSEIHLVRFDGVALPAAWRAPLVLRVKSGPDRMDEAVREAAIQGWLADHGYPVPRVLRVFAPGELIERPMQVMERAPGIVMLERLTRRPWRARSSMGRLAELHTRLHELPTAGFPDDAEDLLDRRLRLVRHTVERVPDAPLARALELVEELEPRLRGGPVSVCHGDFHPLNVLEAADGTSVIDWTDAGLGDRHGDVARTVVLFEVAAIAASSAAERIALRTIGPVLGRRYRRAYEHRLPLDDDRLRLWMPVHVLHGWSQVIALHAGLFDDPDAAGTANPQTARVPRELSTTLRSLFSRLLQAVPQA